MKQKGVENSEDYNKIHNITKKSYQRHTKEILTQKKTTDSILLLEMDKYNRNPRLFAKEKKEA